MGEPTTEHAGGFFTQLMPMLAERTVMMIVSKADEQHLTVSVIPKRMKESENTALTTPLSCVGTPEELDRDLPIHVRDFVAGHVGLSNNLAQIQRERDEAEKTAREDLKKKQKTVGSGGVKSKTLEAGPSGAEKPAQAPVPPPMLSLFDGLSEMEGESPTHPEHLDPAEVGDEGTAP